MPILRQHFQRDEFLGRIQLITVFTPFSDYELRQLSQRELESWRKKVS